MVTQEYVRDLVGNTIFTVDFFKRSTGELRRMNCRLGVRPKTQGRGGPRYDARAHDLVNVYDVQIREYRAVPLENIVEIRARGRVIRLDS